MEEQFSISEAASEFGLPIEAIETAFLTNQLIGRHVNAGDEKSGVVFEREELEKWIASGKDELLTASEAARFLKKPISSVYAARKIKDPRFHLEEDRSMGDIRFKRSDLERYKREIAAAPNQGRRKVTPAYSKQQAEQPEQARRQVVSTLFARPAYRALPAIISALFTYLPAEGEPFPAAQRSAWLQALEATLELAYPNAEEKPAEQ